MAEKTVYHELADELVNETQELIKELVEKELAPMIKYYEKKNRDIFDKAYKEVLELEQED